MSPNRIITNYPAFPLTLRNLRLGLAGRFGPPLTQVQAAKKAKISRSHLANLEQGRVPGSEFLKLKLSVAYGVELEVVRQAYDGSQARLDSKVKAVKQKKQSPLNIRRNQARSSEESLLNNLRNANNPIGLRRRAALRAILWLQINIHADTFHNAFATRGTGMVQGGSMATENTSVVPDASPAPNRAMDELTTFRIEIESTGRLLTQGFHAAPAFLPRELESDHTARRGYEPVAEFGDVAIAQRVIEKLNHRAPLLVRRKDWGVLAGVGLAQLCCQIERTGAQANMLFWTPTSRAARALMDMPTGRPMGPKS